jgi:hypothetical protein
MRRIGCPSSGDGTIIAGGWAAITAGYALAYAGFFVASFS